MKKIYGITGLLVFIIIATALLSDNFLTVYNVENLLRRTALFTIIGFGAALVIIVGGIDLSIGSVICLSGSVLPWLLTTANYSLSASLFIVIFLSVSIGIFHGLLITKLKVQPFIVTLCGLLLYRGIARGITGDQTQGFGNQFLAFREVATGRIPVPGFEFFALPAPLVPMLVIACVLSVVFRLTAIGQHLFAIGFNEQAARYTGIRTDRLQIGAYTASAVLAGIAGILFVSDVNSAQPADFGNFYELYAIAAAVLGGCSLRGGEGSVLGVIVGTAVIQVLRNSITLLDIPTQLEFAIIGAVILVGASIDQLLRLPRVHAYLRSAHTSTNTLLRKLQ